MERVKIKTGSVFSVYGCLVKLLAIEKDAVILQNIRTDKIFSKNIHIFRRIAREAGYKLITQ